MFQVGIARTDITAFKKGVGMLGYGMFFNTMEDIETQLYARTFILKDAKGTKTAIIICELGFITDSLKYGILKYLDRHYASLGYNDTNLFMLAQHTHSGPGGYSHYGLYNMSIPGFVLDIYQHLVERICHSILAAESNWQACKISWSSGVFEPEKEVAFNRSLRAYNENKDVTPLSHEQRHLAVNREMLLMSIRNPEGRLLGSINWFGTHTTSVSNDNHKLCSDNKGYAALYFEKEMATQFPDYIAAFAQGSCGDVSPKFHYNPKRKAQRGYYEGKYPDDFESARYNGWLQYEKAREIEESNNHVPVIGEINSHIRYFDFSRIDIDKEYTGGEEGKFTSPSCLGMSFLEGALMDGPGAPLIVGFFGRKLSRSIRSWELLSARGKDDDRSRSLIRKYQAQGRKDIIIESGEQRMLGTSDIKNLVIPGFMDESIKTFKLFHRKGALGNKPWSPQILPLHVIRVGNVLLAGFPFEITTTAGRRLQASIEALVIDMCIERVILCPYANSYSGYITTYEEYQVQMYEAGHTVFGEWSLAALQTCFKELITEFKSGESSRQPKDIKPLIFSEDELNSRAHYKRQYDIRREKQALRRLERMKKRKSGDN